MFTDMINSKNANDAYSATLESYFAEINKAVQSGLFEVAFEKIYDYYKTKNEINIKYENWQSDHRLDFESIRCIAEDLLDKKTFSYSNDIEKMFKSFYKSFSENNDDFSLSDCEHFVEKYYNEIFIEVNNSDIDKFSKMLTKWIKFKERVRIDIIEPHPDDALGSASAFLYDKHFRTFIHTISETKDTRDNVFLTENYYRKEDGIYIDYSDTSKNKIEIRKKLNVFGQKKYNLTDLNYHERLFNETCEDAVKKYKDKYSSSYIKLKESVKNIFTNVLKSEERYIAFPFSFNHPMHILVTEACLDILDELEESDELGKVTKDIIDRIIVYIDHPYDFQNAETGLFQKRKDYLFSRLDKLFKKSNKSSGFIRCYHSESKQLLLKPIITKIYGVKHYGEFEGALENTACSCFVTKKVKESFKNLLTHNVLYVTAQAAPFYSGGGLGNVAKSFTVAASEFVNDIRIIMPLYHFETNKNNFKYPKKYKSFYEYIISENGIKDNDYNEIEFGNGKIKYCILTGYDDEKTQSITYYFVDIKDCSGNDGEPHKFFNSEDNYTSYDIAAFSMVIKYAILNSGLPYKRGNTKNELTGAFQPNIIHCNDYQTGLIPFLFKLDEIKSYKTLFTIHFGGYEGIFSAEETFNLLRANSSNCRRCISCVQDKDNKIDGICPLTEIDVFSENSKKELGLKPSDYTISCLKAGIRCADKVSTTSEGYAKMLMSYGDKYDGIKITGIRNGIPHKYEKWDGIYESFKDFDSDETQKEICKTVLKIINDSGKDFDSDETQKEICKTILKIINDSGKDFDSDETQKEICETILKIINDSGKDFDSDETQKEICETILKIINASGKDFDSDETQKEICETILKIINDSKSNIGSIYDKKRKEINDFNYENKEKCKKALQHHIKVISSVNNNDKCEKDYEFIEDVNIPLFCMVSRLTPVKGIDAIKNIAQYIAKENMQLVIVGDDEVSFDAKGIPQNNHIYSNLFKMIAKTSKGRIFYMEYSKMKDFDITEHKIYSGSDFVLMPSLDESCGTTQILAMKNGTIPIVTSLESFKDTVANYYDWNEKENFEKQGIGFFTHKDACWTLLTVIQRVIKEYNNYREYINGKLNDTDKIKNAEKFKAMIVKNFNTDFSWQMGSIKKYVELYNDLLMS